MRVFLEMNGYWAFVWSAFAIAMGGLVLSAWQAKRLLARAQEEARRKLAMKESQ